MLCLHSCFLASFPCVSLPSSSCPRLPDWNDLARKLRDKSVFWHKVWVEAGCPSSGVLFAIKHSTKSRFKYEVRHLKCRKDSLANSDANGIVSEHLKFCSSVIVLPLSPFFMAIVHHEHMPQILCDSTLVPILKNNKDAFVSGNYRPIALSSTLSKVLEWLLVHKYSSIAVTCSFGFKELLSVLELSKILFLIMLIMVSPVFGYFLDPTKAFDLVDHCILIHKLWTMVSHL